MTPKCPKCGDKEHVYVPPFTATESTVFLRCGRCKHSWSVTRDEWNKG